MSATSDYLNALARRDRRIDDKQSDLNDALRLASYWRQRAFWLKARLWFLLQEEP